MNTKQESHEANLERKQGIYLHLNGSNQEQIKRKPEKTQRPSQTERPQAVRNFNQFMQVNIRTEKLNQKKRRVLQGQVTKKKNQSRKNGRRSRGRKQQRRAMGPKLVTRCHGATQSRPRADMYSDHHSQQKDTPHKFCWATRKQKQPTK